MKLSTIISTVLLSIMCFVLNAGEVTFEAAFTVAQTQLTRLKHATVIAPDRYIRLTDQQLLLGYVFILQPRGYIVVTADDRLAPILAYSDISSYYSPDAKSNVLQDIIVADLKLRMNNLQLLSIEQQNANRAAWANLLSRINRPPLEQWPPEGSTNTGGWIKTTWNQSAPYNQLCPMDNVTGNRSLAGCPAVAMAQIVNYHQTINGTEFNSMDRYHHNYGGNNYWIDDDAVEYDFPDFEELNALLDTLVNHYKYQLPVTDMDRAALIFGCGVGATQVYGSGGSGTFTVSQAWDAYDKFRFNGMELLSTGVDCLYERIADNMRHGLPVHYAIVTPGWDAGHNVVVDGYNTDGFFHVNFGWGGAYDGWYLLPSGLPYNLTVLEGAIVDIRPPTLVGVFPPQIEMYTLEQLWNENCVTLWNNSNEQITIQEVQMDHAFGTMYWDVNPSYLLPHVLDLGEDMTVAVELLVPLAAPVRDTISTLMRVIYTQGAMNIPVITTRELLAMEAADAVNPAQRESISFYPNPFHCAVTINFATHPKADSQLSIYNTKGQLIRKFTFSEQENAVETVWDGSDEAGNPVPSGVYFYRFMSGKHRQTGKMTYLK